MTAFVSALALTVGTVSSRADEPATKPADGDAHAARPLRFRNTLKPTSGAASDRFVFRATPAGLPAKTTYLGVVASPAHPALQKQLKLKPGVGLVVDAVEQDSPAARAGVREYDVLHKLDDQLLINNEQFDVLVRSAEAGREVKLTVIREGKPQTLTATLAERELEAMNMSMEPGGEMGMEFDPAGLTPVPGAASEYTAFFAAPRAGSGGPRGVPGAVTVRTPDGKQQVNAARIIIESDRHKMTVTNPDGRKHLRVEDKSGAVLFDGPVDTPAELEKVPDELRQAYEEIFADAVLDEAQPKPAPAPPTTVTK